MLAAFLLLAAAAAPAPDAASREEQLARHRNLGKAFYENPTTQYQAVEELKKALDLAPGSARERLNYGLALLRAGKIPEGIAELMAVQEQDPALPHTWWNLGIVYKNDSRHEEAVAQLEEMVRRVPDEAAAHYNLGVLYKIAGKPDLALRHLEEAARLAPDMAAPRFQLYNAYKQAGRAEDSRRELALFQEIKKRQVGAAVPEDPDWSWFSELYDPVEAVAAGAEADRPAKPAFEPREVATGLAAPDAAGGASATVESGQATAEGDAEDTGAVADAAPHVRGAGSAGLDPGAAGLAVLDADGDLRPDLLAWSGKGVRLLKGGAEPVASSGLERLGGIVAAVPGDFDNDGLADLAVLDAGGARLFANRGGRFEELSGRLPASIAPGPPQSQGPAPSHEASQGPPPGTLRDVPPGLAPGSAQGRFRAAAWLDYDHDYDLDLLLLGEAPALARNNGDGTWSDETARFPFTAGRALAVATLDVVSDTQGIDVAVSHQDGSGVLYRDRLGGRYEAEPLPALPAGARALAAYDFDGDGWTDLAAATPAGLLLLKNDRRDRGLTGTWEPLPAPGSSAAPSVPSPSAPGSPASQPPPSPSAPAPSGSASSAPAASSPATSTPALARRSFLFADLENRGVADLVAGGAVHRGAGRGAFAAAPTWEIASLVPDLFAPHAALAAAALVSADFDADGRTDLAVLAGGSVRLLFNRTETPNRSLRVALQGVKNLKLAAGAEVEVKAGSGYQKKLYAGVPLVFGLGTRAVADTVRITWPNGLIQNETRQAAGSPPAYKEAQRLSGSCPMIFTWDGEGFRFITDVLGVAPLGASAGDGEYFPVDHDEYVQIPGDALVAVDGRYEIRVTEELREVSYLDQIELVAVDRPAGVEVFTNDKFKGPPFPEFRLFGATRRIHPLRATDARGEDVRERLLARDGRYPDGFRRDYAGVAELHHLDLDFGDGRRVAADGRAVLILSGWVDWADGSTFLGAAQGAAGGLLMPQLQVRDAAGQWRTVIEDMGLPAGKPKTIAVDLTGKLLSPSREVRIVTNLCIYWDEAFLIEETGPPPVRLTRLAPAGAELRFRGFSTPEVHPERKQPETFDYQRPLPPERWTWNPTPGLYTRFGDVRPLLAATDDLLVVMGSGDEVSLTFAAAALPPLPPGHRRDFLLLVDGWAKDGDANTAFSQTVEPLPFHGMSQYPPPDPERFPDGPVHKLYRETYNTRPALRLLRPLAGEGVEKP